MIYILLMWITFGVFVAWIVDSAFFEPNRKLERARMHKKISILGISGYKAFVDYKLELKTGVVRKHHPNPHTEQGVAGLDSQWWKDASAKDRLKTHCLLNNCDPDYWVALAKVESNEKR